jgi:hypothetical protein
MAYRTVDIRLLAEDDIDVAKLFGVLVATTLSPDIAKIRGAVLLTNKGFGHLTPDDPMIAQETGWDGNMIDNDPPTSV